MDSRQIRCQDPSLLSGRAGNTGTAALRWLCSSWGKTQPHAVAPLEPLPDLTAAQPGLRPTQTQSCPLSYLKTDSLHNEGWSGRNLILLHVLLLLSMNLSHSSQFESVYIHMPMFAISSV